MISPLFLKPLRCASLLVLALVAAWPALAQLTINITSVPASTPAVDPIHIAGTFNSWDPAATAYQLTNQGNGQYTITLPTSVRGIIKFKFARGSWSKVETQASGADIADRTYTIPATGAATVNLTIAGWKDTFTWPGPGSTATSSVSIMAESFAIPQLSRTRRIWLYLPPDYATSTKTYPVLYMHDGQNLFDATTAFSGEWGVDETLDNLQRQGDWGCIVVGIENSSNRLDEYSPYTNPQYGGGQGDQYVDFIANTLKPYVDQHYRTRPDRQNTGIAGSSMGGLISLYGALKRPDVFGRAGVFSPSLWFNRKIYAYAKQSTPTRPDPRIYLVSGSAESATQARDQRQMVDTLAAAGYLIGVEVDTLIVRGGGHNESSWKQQFAAAYRYLFAGTTAVQAELPAPAFKLVPNPLDSNHDVLTVVFTDPSRAPKAAQAELLDVQGRILRRARLAQGKASLNVRALPAGAYRVRVGKAVQGFVRK